MVPIWALDLALAGVLTLPCAGLWPRAILLVFPVLVSPSVKWDDDEGGLSVLTGRGVPRGPQVLGLACALPWCHMRHRCRAGSGPRSRRASWGVTDHSCFLDICANTMGTMDTRRRGSLEAILEFSGAVPTMDSPPDSPLYPYPIRLLGGQLLRGGSFISFLHGCAPAPRAATSTR